MADPYSVRPEAEPSSCCVSWTLPFQRQEDERKYAGTDAELAREMNEMSIEDREKVFDDVHGVAKIQEETPKFVADRIREMEHYFGKREQKALNRALFLRPDLQTDTQFKLMFLRAVEYDPRKAVERMGRYFEHKQKLFGEEQLVKRITWDDLGGLEREIFETGHFSALPLKDQRGRPVIFMDENKINYDRWSLETMLRALWYLTMSTIMEEEVAQKAGMCLVYYFPFDAFKKQATDQASPGGEMLQALPFRYTAVHMCFENTFLNFLIPLLRATMGKVMRLRIRAHIGSEIENEYTLMTFGIHAEGLLQGAKDGDMQYCQEYVKKRNAIDKSLTEAEDAMLESSPGIIPYPGPKDVLIGRGVSYTQYIGNQKWNQLIHWRLDEYMATNDRFEKTCITMNVVQSVHGYKGRFLQRTSNGWKILDETYAREKVAIAFRSRAKTTLTPSSMSSNGIRRRRFDPSVKGKDDVV